MNETVQKEARALIESSKNVFVSSVDTGGHPNTKAMFALLHEGPVTHYFSTNLSARRTRQFMENPKACIYFCSETEFKGLMLIGKMQVLTDKVHKALLWREGFEQYYPNGIDDEDYCVLKFTAETGNYYHWETNCSFYAKEL